MTQIIASTESNRAALIRCGRYLEYFTIGYNSLEGLIAVGAGLMAGKFALTAHVTSSVGLGAITAYLGLAVAALISENGQMVRASYLAMELIIKFIILPLSIASLLTGLVSSLGTSWGLFRHYWVVFKLVLNVFANVILLMYMQSIIHYTSLAADSTLSNADLMTLRDPTHVVHSSGALILLLSATVLRVYKPRGVTPYGRRKQELRKASDR